MNTHLIWFCGTGESINTETKENNPSHLFKGIKEHCSIIPGWGTENNFGNNMSYIKAQSSGVNEKDLPFIDSCIKGALFDKKEKILNCKNLIIGGFSRGAAFFVPYFLKFLDEKFFSFEKQPKIILLLMDPVTGSKNDEDVTEKTLKDLKILNKEQLMRNFKDRIDSLIFLSTGFDKRQRNFKLDKSFWKLREVFERSLITKIGLTHSALSVWSKQEQKDIEKFVETINYGEYRKRPFLRNVIITDKKRLEKFKDGLLKSFPNPDINITKNVFEDLITHNGFLSSSTFNTIYNYDSFTEKYLGKISEKNGVDYSSDFIWKGDNDLYCLENNSRIEVKFDVKPKKDKWIIEK